MNIQLAGQSLELLPERAVWWPAQRTAVVADVHLGKDQVFRRAGIAIPPAVLDAELSALDALARSTCCERLLVLGDLVHAPPAEGETWPDTVRAWRMARRELAIDLVLGNHDRRLAPWLAEWSIRGHDEGLEISNLGLFHEVDCEVLPAGMSGHVHPVAWLRSGRERLRLPVFARRGDHLVLPAFGRFTGGDDGLDRPGWALFAATPGRVFRLQRPARRRPAGAAG